METRKHAILSASSSHRWLNCPPSVRLTEGVSDEVSEFALEGTDAHTLCEYKLRRALDLVAGEPPMPRLDWYSDEMEECANGYVEFILEKIERVRKLGIEPLVLIEQVLGDCELMRKAIVDFEKIDNQIVKQQEKVEMIAEIVKNLVRENASTPQSQDEYIKKYESLKTRYEEEYRKLENLQKDKELRISKDKTMEVFIENLKNQPMMVDRWDETLWSLMIEKAVVGSDGSIRFIFYNGTEISEEA